MNMADISWRDRLFGGLKRTSDKLGDNLTGLFGKAALDAQTLDEIEEALILSDLGPAMAVRVRERLAHPVRVLHAAPLMRLPHRQRALRHDDDRVPGVPVPAAFAVRHERRLDHREVGGLGATSCRPVSGSRMANSPTAPRASSSDFSAGGVGAGCCVASAMPHPDEAPSKSYPVRPIGKRSQRPILQNAFSGAIA